MGLAFTSRGKMDFLFDSKSYGAFVQTNFEASKNTVFKGA